MDFLNSFLDVHKSIYGYPIDIQYSTDLWISKNWFVDIQKLICGYPKIDLWISKMIYRYPEMIYGYTKLIYGYETAPHSSCISRYFIALYSYT